MARPVRSRPVMVTLVPSPTSPGCVLALLSGLGTQLGKEPR